MKNLSTIGAVALVVLFIAMIVCWPLLLIFAINTLFPLLSIPYSFLTWLSVCVLNISTFGGLVAILRRIESKL